MSLQPHSSVALQAAETTPSRSLAEAITHHRAGRLAEAERCYRSALATDNRSAEALHGLGLLALQAGDPRLAVKLLGSAIELDDGQPTYFSNLGNAFQLAGRVEAAIRAYRRALLLCPGSASVHSNLGMAHFSQGRLEEALRHLQSAARLEPANAQIHDNLGNVFQALGRLEEAVTSHRRALQRIPSTSPQTPEIVGNFGLALAGSGEWGEAMSAFQLALHTQPANARIQLARAQLQLLLGDFLPGFRNYEWRKQVHGARSLPGRPWQGEVVQPGETLLLYAEQGLGDTLQFLRFLPWVQRQLPPQAALVLEVQEPLRRLVPKLRESSQVLVFGESLPRADWQCSLMGLPLVYLEQAQATGQEVALEFSASVPYLTIPPEAIDHAAASMEPESEHPFRVGLVWTGNRSHARDRFRSIPPRLLKPILEIEGIGFHSLQLEESAPELADRIADHRASLRDMADTAALIDRLDLILGVDTAVVHLAGSLGKPVWTMLPFWPDWRWRLDRSDCPWYPTMRLFRQQKPGDWGGVLHEVRASLIQQVTKRQRA